MSNDTQETPKAAAAFLEYCALGYDRSLAKLAAKLGKTTAYIRQLEYWSSQHNWQERVKVHDAEQAQAQAAIIAAEKAKVLTSRYALMHKRVEALDAKAAQLYALSESEANLWLTTDRGGMTFNGELFRELRGAYADIAAELGERVKTTKQEHSGSIDVNGAKDSLLSRLGALPHEQESDTA